MLCVDKFEESPCASFLLLLAMQVENRQVNIIQQSRKVVNACTRTEEDNDLLLRMLLQESEQQAESNVGRAHDVTLLKAFSCRVIVSSFHVDIQRARPQ